MFINHFGTCQNEEVLHTSLKTLDILHNNFLMLCMAATLIIEVDNTII